MNQNQFIKGLVLSIFLGLFVGYIFFGAVTQDNPNFSVNPPATQLNSLESTNPSTPVILSDDAYDYEYYGSVSTAYYYKTGTASSSYYQVVWLQPLDTYDTFDLNIYSDSAYSSLIYGCAPGAGELAWVVYRPASDLTLYPRAYTTSGTGYAYIEWEDSSVTISTGSYISEYLDDYECLEIYMAYLSSGTTYYFKLIVPTYGDFDLYLCGLAAGSAVCHSGFSSYSATYGNGVDEAISSYYCSTTDYYAIIVKRTSGYGTYSLSYATGNIVVSTPSSSTSWTAGSSRYIYWSSSGCSSYVTIELYDDGSYYRTIASSTYNSGSYSWTIPSNLPPSDYYQIKITDYSDSTIYDYSNNFSTTARVIPGFTLGYLILTLVMVIALIFTLVRKRYNLQIFIYK